MTSPEWSSLLELYQQILGHGVLQYLEKQGGWKRRRGIYSSPVVLWLMMLQRLQGRGTLASGVQLLLAGAAETDLLPHRGLLPGAVEIAETIVQASEPGNYRTIARDAAAGRSDSGICVGRFVAGAGI